MNKPINFLAIACCFTLSASPAYAEPRAHGEHMFDSMTDEHMPGAHMSAGRMHEQMEDRHFKEMDTNGDGVVSKAEFDAAHDKHFKELDANGDGNLTLDEMRAGHKQAIEEIQRKRFDEADLNHDGALTREESKKIPMLSRHFKAADTNKDGKVTREEFDAAMEKMRKKRDNKEHADW